jgi:hypothetical protein
VSFIKLLKSDDANRDKEDQLTARSQDKVSSTSIPDALPFVESFKNVPLENLNKQTRTKRHKFSKLLLLMMLALFSVLVVLGYFLITNAKHATKYLSANSDINLSQKGHTNSKDTAFNFGYDLAYIEPDWYKTNAQSDANAIKVLSNTPGAIVDQTLYGEGVTANPEPSPGNFNVSDFSYPDNVYDHSLGSRITLIRKARDTPAITLLGVPPWMYGCASIVDSTNGVGNCKSCSNGNGTTHPCTKSPCDPDVWSASGYNPPCPAYYQDFASLAAHVAASFPQVKYFIVWNEFKGFMDNGAIDASHYTAMYNDVYAAIKKVRPDALVGGPYAPMGALPLNGQSCSGYTLCSNSWGRVPQPIIAGFSYWLANKSGADFLTVDGPTEIASASNGIGNNTIASSPLAVSQMYAAVDIWIRSQTSLPIWWMEAHIQPCDSTTSCNPSAKCTSVSCWSDKQAAASRIATLALMNASGASVGMWWQPQEEPDWQDQGLWTSTLSSDGGQPTTLDLYLNQTASILRQRLTSIGGQPNGVMVVTSGSQALLINTMNHGSSATLNKKYYYLAPGQILIEK